MYTERSKCKSILVVYPWPPGDMGPPSSGGTLNSTIPYHTHPPLLSGERMNPQRPSLPGLLIMCFLPVRYDNCAPDAVSRTLSTWWSTGISRQTDRQDIVPYKQRSSRQRVTRQWLIVFCVGKWNLSVRRKTWPQTSWKKGWEKYTVVVQIFY